MVTLTPREANIDAVLDADHPSADDSHRMGKALETGVTPFVDRALLGLESSDSHAKVPPWNPLHAGFRRTRGGFAPSSEFELRWHSAVLYFGRIDRFRTNCAGTLQKEPHSSDCSTRGIEGDLWYQQVAAKECHLVASRSMRQAGGPSLPRDTGLCGRLTEMTMMFAFAGCRTLESLQLGHQQKSTGRG